MLKRMFEMYRFMPKMAPDTGAAGGTGGSNNEANPTGEGNQEGNPAGKDGGQQTSGDDKDTYEQLLEKLTEARNEALQSKADAEKWKLANDKSSSDAAKYKKQLTEKMTAEEQLDAAKKEAEEAREKEFAQLKNELATIQATKRYMALEMDEKLSEETAKAEIAGDMETVTANIGKHIKAIKDAAYHQALKDRPDINAGNGESDKNEMALSMAAAYASRKNGVNMDILNQY